jgi:hypothetical protein
MGKIVSVDDDELSMVDSGSLLLGTVSGGGMS